MLVSDRTPRLEFRRIEQQIVGNPTTVFPQRDLGEGLGVFVVLLEVLELAVQPLVAVGGMDSTSEPPSGMYCGLLRRFHTNPPTPMH